MIKTLGYSDQMVGYLSALPNLCGVAGMLLFSRNSNRTGERLWHVALPCLLASVGLLGAGLTLAFGPVLAMAWFCLAGFGGVQDLARDRRPGRLRLPWAKEPDFLGRTMHILPQLLAVGDSTRRN
jgi:hypothetical protein